jgi:hypothetical protein
VRGARALNVALLARKTSTAPAPCTTPKARRSPPGTSPSTTAGSTRPPPASGRKATSTSRCRPALRNPAPKGGSGRLRATLKVVSPGAGSPTGSIVFREGETILATAPVSNQVATFPLSALPAGEHQIVASYTGNANYMASGGSLVQWSNHRLVATGRELRSRLPWDRPSRCGCPRVVPAGRSGRRRLARAPAWRGRPRHGPASVSGSASGLTGREGPRTARNPGVASSNPARSPACLTFGVDPSPQWAMTTGFVARTP